MDSVRGTNGKLWTGRRFGLLLWSLFASSQDAKSLPIPSHPDSPLVLPAVPPGQAALPAREDREAHLPGRARRRPGCAGVGAPRQRSLGADRDPERGRVAPASRAGRREPGPQNEVRPRRPAGVAAVPGALSRRRGPRPGAGRQWRRRGPGRRAAAAAGRAAESRVVESRRRQRRQACGTVAARAHRPPGAETTGGSLQPLRPARQGAPAGGEACVR